MQVGEDKDHLEHIIQLCVIGDDARLTYGESSTLSGESVVVSQNTNPNLSPVFATSLQHL